MSPKFRVAICGGGVGGLTLAVALSRYPDITVDVYEAAHSFREIGAGVGIWPRSFKVLQKLGADLEQQLLQCSSSQWTEEFVPSIKYRKSDQAVGTELFTLMTKGRLSPAFAACISQLIMVVRAGELMRFHRAHFHGIFLSHLPPHTTHNAKRLKSYIQPRSRTSPITLTFTDGSTATCDVLIGADGIKSAVRNFMMRELAETVDPGAREYVLSCIKPVWSGVTAYRTLIPAEKLRARCPDHRALREPVQYLGKGAFFLVYPISQGQYVNFAGFTLQSDLVDTAYEANAGKFRPSFEGKANNDWVGEITAEQLVQPFKNFEEDAHPILESIQGGTLWAVHTVKTLPATNFGRVALLGDAAHAMMPFQGSGAGQSVEDAYLLATVLGHRSTTLQTIPRALAIYDKLRRPFSADVALRSRLNGQLCTFQKDVRLHELGDRMTKNWEWAWLTELDDDLKEAIRLVEDRSFNII